MEERRQLLIGWRDGGAELAGPTVNEKLWQSAMTSHLPKGGKFESVL